MCGTFPRWFSNYEKVLLRERKRHTARHVVSTHSVVLSWLTPHPPGWPSSGWLTPPRLTDTPLAGLTHPPGWTDPPPGWTDPPLGWTDPPPLGWTDPPTPSPLAEPPPCGQTDRHVSKHYLPVVLRTRAVKSRCYRRHGSELIIHVP